MKQSNIIKIGLVVLPFGMMILGALSLIYSLNAPASKSREGGRSVLNVKVLSTPDELKALVKRQAYDIGTRPWQDKDNTRITAKWIESELGEENIGYRSRVTFIGDKGKDYRIIEVESPGESLAEEVLLVVSNFSSPDSSPGANYNASSVSMFLGLARYFVNTKNARTIRFVACPSRFPDSDSGSILSTSYIAEKCKREKEKLVGVVEIGSLGFFSEEPNSQSFPNNFDIDFPTTANFIALIGSQSSHQSMGSFISGFTKSSNIPVQKVSLDDEEISAFDGLSVFTEKGYPVIRVSDTGALRYTHHGKKTDTPDKINFYKMAEILKVLSLTISTELNP
ncbi:MAG: hypothetical protein CMO54_00440 [Verrucomicrobiales bacterium]|nr:hypothetical protein [Verrucomicrobiales bacterium]